MVFDFVGGAAFSWAFSDAAQKAKLPETQPDRDRLVERRGPGRHRHCSISGLGRWLVRGSSSINFGAMYDETQMGCIRGHYPGVSGGLLVGCRSPSDPAWTTSACRHKSTIVSATQAGVQRFIGQRTGTSPSISHVPCLCGGHF